MDKNKLVNLLCELNDRNAADGVCSDEQYFNKFEEICGKLNCCYEIISEELSNITTLNFSNNLTGEWKYICLSFYILKLINADLSQLRDNILSVQQTKELKKCILNLARAGISRKLIPKLPFSIKNENQANEDVSVTYNILKCTTFGLCEFLKLKYLRPLILPESLKEILVSIYQIAYSPLKKPDPTQKIMTEEMYHKITEERKQFLLLLGQLRDTIHPSIYVKETMVILHASAPAWFKKAVSQTLTCILRSKNGVENILSTLLDGVSDDTTQSWKILEVCRKLILCSREHSDFEDNICKQLISLLHKSNGSSLMYERVFVHCAKSLYGIDSVGARNILINPVFAFFLQFTNDYKFSHGEDITRMFKHYVRLLHSLYLENSTGLPKLPLLDLQQIIHVLFRFYCLLLGSSFTSTSEDLRGLLTISLSNYEGQNIAAYDCFLFGIASENVLPFRNDIVLTLDGEKICIHLSEQAITYSPAENSECITTLFKSKEKLKVQFFVFLLNCLSDKDKYFKTANEDLLALENELMNEYLERSLVVYKLLSELAADNTVQKEITEKPEFVIGYIQNVLCKTIDVETHKSADIESEEFQSVFTILMILQSLVFSASNLEPFKILIKSLRKISEEACNEETKNIVDDILDTLGGTKKTARLVVGDVKTELDKAIEELCDPLLPVRGHALMRLAKLVEQKDSSVIERKQYVLNTLQQNLKNEDSYLYLSAIGGLAAMADLFPDTVLNVLCEEYSDSARRDKDDGDEVRMKLGECLMRAIRLLGDMAPKYKPRLLNTFLLGAKDDDDLIRASALSNLGEICRVLGYKLGSILTEVLVCVHAVISTDKSPQARRSAVTVLRQLFVGLESEMIDFLKDEILPIYRTLKDIYQNDKDDVMRLQAQLALEELNENVKKFLSPTPQLSEKKIVILN